jgi:RimJ/RimL family protein N-acetyltransferase
MTASGPPSLSLPSPQLVDGEVALRAWREDDVPALVAICHEETVQRCTRIPSGYTEQDGHRRVARALAEREAGRALQLAVVDAHTDTLLGSLDLCLSATDPRVGELRYMLAQTARQRGVMTRAVRLLSRWAIEELSLARIEILTDPDNRASVRVALRAGFTREGVLRAYRQRDGVRQDRVVFSLLADDPSAAFAVMNWTLVQFTSKMKADRP